MLLLISSQDEVYIITDLKKHMVEVEPTFVEKIDPKTHISQISYYSNYKYTLTSNDEIIFVSDSEMVRDKVASELINLMIENSYQGADVYIELDDLIYNIEKELNEEGQTFDQRE